MSNKLDLFGVLEVINKKQRNFYDDLTDDEQKQFHPLVIQRWLSGTTDARQVYFLNELVNPFIFSLHKHKELLAHLLTVCAPGGHRRYKWAAAKSKKTTNMPLVVSVIKQQYGYNTIDAIDVLPLLTDDAILHSAEMQGLQKEDISKIKKELKTRKDS